MKTIYKIAKTELKTLFYSPVAWLIIVIFTFQASMAFTEIYGGHVKRVATGWQIYNVTIGNFAGWTGLFTSIQQYLYLYIPLLTMGVMSREFSSGSIKLLYSSPLTSSQIVLGKFLGLVIFALALCGVLCVYSIYGVLTIVNVDIPVILTGFLGVFLLICAYASIGLFMSSLTSYTVVSAIGTLTIFALLSYVRGVGQEIEFVRDITYWLALSGRSDTFINGMITSEDLIYFIVVITLFLSFTIIKIQSAREKSSLLITFGKYALTFIIVTLIGYASALPQFKLYKDVTRTNQNTLNKSSQEVLSHLKGGLTINTYTNMQEENLNISLPISYKNDVYRFAQYVRFKPEIKLKNTYYYHKAKYQHLDDEYPNLNEKQRMDTLTSLFNYKFKIHPYSEIKENIDLSKENYRFVRSLELENGKRTFLRVYDDDARLPSEAEITAAFKRLVMDKLPTVGFLTGHGERGSNAQEDRGYNMIAQEKTFRYSLINQGFDFQNVILNKKVPENIRILVIAESRKNLLSKEKVNLDQYIQRGGNLVIAGEPGTQQYMNPLVADLGVTFLPGMLVKPTAQYQSNLLLLSPTIAATKFSHHFDGMRKTRKVLTMPTAGALEFSTDKGFDVTTLFTSDTTGGWNELQTTNFVDDSASYNPQMGEMKKPFPTVIALSRKVNNKEQKILVTGDADWLSNGELMIQRKDVPASNYSLINGAFFWLTDEELPVDMRTEQTTDNALRVGQKGWNISVIALKWVFPILLALIGTLIWIRRKGR